MAMRSRGSYKLASIVKGWLVFIQTADIIVSARHHVVLQ